jgi:hypothetical protein
MKNNTIMMVVVALIVGGGAFFGGMKYQQSKVPSFNSQFGGNRNGNGNQAGARRMGGGQILGDIISADDKSITVKLVDGSSKIVLFSATTSINKASEGTATDLTTGTKVAVFGTTNTDGSVTAQNIQINPIQRERPSVTPWQ